MYSCADIQVLLLVDWGIACPTKCCKTSNLLITTNFDASTMELKYMRKVRNGELGHIGHPEKRVGPKQPKHSDCEIQHSMHSSNSLSTQPLQRPHLYQALQHN